MPVIGRGENIGRAWYKVEAVGDKFDDSGFTSGVQKSLRDIGDIAENEGGLSGRTYAKKFVEGNEQEMKKRRGRFRRALDDMFDGFAKGQRAVDRADNSISRFGRNLDHLVPTISRAFGRGSRNDFIHFFGSLVGGMARLIPLTVQAGGALFNMGTNARRGWHSLGDGASVFARLGASIGAVVGPGGLGGLVAKLPAMVVGFGATAVVVGTVVAAMSLLLGVVTALASSLAFALVGAVGALLAVLTPLAAGLGVLGLAFVGMDAKAKKLAKEALKPLGEAFKVLGSAARDGLFPKLPEIGERLGKVFRGMEPLVRKVAAAMGDVGIGFAKAMQSKGFKDFRNAMESFLPGAVRRLGDIFRQTIGGFGGILRGSIPFMQRVLGWLDKITKRFSDWANGPGADTAIDNFWKRTENSLKSVGHFLDSVWDLLKEVMSAGKGAGDSIFESMARGVDNWTKALQKNPDILKDWFTDALKFAEALGKLITGFGKLVDLLDNSFTRSLATGFVTAIGTIAKVLGSLDKATGGALGRNLGIIATAIGGLWIAAKVATGVKALGTALGLLRVGASVAAAGGAAGGAAAGGAAAGGLAGLVAGLRSRIGAAFRGLGKFLWKGAGALLVIDLGVSLAQKITGEGKGGLLGELKSEIAYAKTAWNDIKRLFGQPVYVKMNTAEVRAAETMMNTLSQKFRNTFLTPLFPKVNPSGIDALNILLGTTKTKADNLHKTDATPKANASVTDNLMTALDGVKTKADRAKGSDATPKTNPGSLTGVQTALGGVLTKAQQAHAQDATPRVQGSGFFGGIIGTLGNILQTAIKSNKQDATPKVGAPTGLGAALSGFGNLGKAMSGISNKPAKPRAEDGGTFGKVSGAAGRLKTAIGGIPKSAKTSASDGGTFGKIRTLAANLKKAIDQVPKSTKVGVTESGAGPGKTRVDALRSAINRLPTSKTITITTVERTVTRATGGVINAGLERLAAGGFANYRQRYGNNIIGEAGREAIVPLDRPLMQIDPAVRELAAFAQGKLKGMNTGPTIDASGWTIQSDTADPHAVAIETLNELTGRLL